MTGDFLNTGLTVEHINSLRAILVKFSSVEQVKLYGSRAKGSFKKGSDVDLVFLGDISHQELMTIDSLIDDLLTPYSYDLSIMSDITNTDLISHIERVGLVVYP